MAKHQIHKRKNPKRQAPSFRHVAFVKTHTRLEAFGAKGNLKFGSEDITERFKLTEKTAEQKAKYVEVCSFGESQAIRATFNFETLSFSFIKSRFGRSNFSILEPYDFIKLRALDYVQNHGDMISSKKARLISYINRFEVEPVVSNTIMNFASKIVKARKAYLISIHHNPRKRKRKA